MKIPVTDQFLWLLYDLGCEISMPLAEIFRLRGKQDLNPEAKEFWKAIERKKNRKQFGQFINYLKKQGYIEIAATKGKQGILLTSKGKGKSLKVKYKLGSEFKKRKDKKWIMVVFDIPEKMRKYRDEFRKYLLSFGFKKFQKSIWVCPYDTLEDLNEVINIYSLDKFIRIFIVEEVEVH